MKNPCRLLEIAPYYNISRSMVGGGGIIDKNIDIVDIKKSTLEINIFSDIEEVDDDHMTPVTTLMVFKYVKVYIRNIAIKCHVHAERVNYIRLKKTQ